MCSVTLSCANSEFLNGALPFKDHDGLLGEVIEYCEPECTGSTYEPEAGIVNAEFVTPLTVYVNDLPAGASKVTV
jgi:hypothetical protein